MKRFLALFVALCLVGCSSVPDTLNPEQAEPALKVLLNNAQGPQSIAPANIDNLTISACQSNGARVVCDVSLTFRGEAIRRRAAFLPLRHDASRFAAIWMPR